jgi:hypothetical protein
MLSAGIKFCSILEALIYYEVKETCGCRSYKHIEFRHLEKIAMFADYAKLSISFA